MDTLSIFIQTNVFGEWCSLVEIVRLDSAKCNRINRQQFLKLLSSNVFTVESNHQMSPQKSLDWMALRGLKMRHCFICRDCVNFSDILDVSKINSLEFNEDCKITEAGIVEIINICSNVSSVVIYHKQLTLQNLAPKLDRLSEFDHIVVWGKYARVGFLPGPPDLLLPSNLSSDVWSKCSVALEFPEGDDILISAFYRKDSKLFNFNDILHHILTLYSSTLKYVKIYLYTPNSIDLNLLVDLCVSCPRLKSIFVSHNEEGRGDAAFSLIHDGGCDQLELHCSPSCITYTELNMLYLFEKLKGVIAFVLLSIFCCLFFVVGCIVLRQKLFTIADFRVCIQVTHYAYYTLNTCTMI
jgi:hypothetical protein